MSLCVVLVGAVLLRLCACDVYMHNPRGSNNRLSEQSATRTTGNRLFDSQNNARGGYNVGDLLSTPANGDADKQYSMKYFQSAEEGSTGRSYLTLEWTNQHGCGGNEQTDPHKQNCEIILQFMCQPVSIDSRTQTMRDGTSTNRPNYTPPGSAQETATQRQNRLQNVDPSRGQHEGIYSYDACYKRERNKGLFTADQNLKNNKLGVSSAIHTRQNSNGNRNGYECPEERDYYPYWHPSDWRDIAILTDQPERCQEYMQQSFNTQPYHECVSSTGLRDVAFKANNAADCDDEGGLWVELHSYLQKTDDGETACQQKGYKWAVPHDAEDVNVKQCLVTLASPDCQQAPWSRSNHLGNGRDNVMLNYTWTLPHFPSGEDQRCVLRIRNNVSTDDYPWTTDSSQNGNDSPVENNPTVDIGASTNLNLAINTAQTGRTFQDRSHIFILRPRPSGVGSRTIYNLNTRGKRGNIVQAYPALEYDFTPTTLNVKSTDLVHIQWTGSNTHNNGNPAGDGQAGDDGNGKGGTDRTNILQIGSLNDNYPLPQHQMTMMEGATVHWSAHNIQRNKWTDVALELASAGKYLCELDADCPGSSDKTVESGSNMNNLLDNAPASYEGMLLSFQPGDYDYICTRNNDFSNRSHKGKLIVS